MPTQELSRRAAPLVLAAAFAMLPGCYGTQLANLEVRTARIEDGVTKLQRTQSEAAANLAEMQRLLQEQVELARSGRAASEERLKEIQRLVQIVATKLDESSVKMSELKDEAKYRTQPAAHDTAAPAPGSTGTTPSVTPRALYDAAYQDLTRGNHGLAIMGFQEVIAKYPDSELADNSQYWIGESYYAQKDWKQAQKEFQKVADNYPKGDKLPAALLKMGFCEQQLGDKAAARAAFRKLVDSYPDAEEARLAKDKLKEN